ncbi:HAD-IB family phosphatase [Agrobacterium pusense]|uniref:HAD-IB family phosphatase n=1 Tax=Agrobacterium pusense TaxID=648995 RepID=UPI003FD18404|nr:HAD-IB family phosphatase [Agrobacterium sp. S2]
MIDHFLFDLDGTITTEELLPIIARACGVEEEIKKLTDMTISGDIPFEYSLRHRVDILKSVPVSLVQDIVLTVGIDPYIRDFLEENRAKCTIVTGNLDVWLAKLSTVLPIPMMSSCASVENDRIIDLYRIMDKSFAPAAFEGNVCAVGDGNNDFGMLSSARVGVAYGGVHAPAASLLEIADFATYDGKTLCRLLSQL